MVEKRFNKLGFPDIECFENYLPTAFSSELTLLQKVNKIIQDLIESNKLTNEMVEYLNNFIETFDEKLYQTTDDIVLKWIEDGIFEDIISDVAMKIGIFGDFRPWEEKLIPKIKNEFTERAINVKWFGAIGDGETDDFNSVQLAIDYGSENNIPIYFPYGVYNINPTTNDKNSGRQLYLKTNTHLIFNPDTVLYAPNVILVANSETTGYDGGQQNITIKNGTITGDFNVRDINGTAWYNGRVCGAFHHTKNMTVEDVTFKHCVSDSHMFDLSGCSDIVIRNCKFMGVSPSELDREYVEAIQIDTSYLTGLTWKGDNQGMYCDGLPTINVLVENCEFLPIYNRNNEMLYPAPCGVGNHVDNGTGTFKNITIKNCTFLDSIESENPSIEAPDIRIWSGENILIENNTFINTRNKRVKGIALISATNPTPWREGITVTPKESKNIIVRNNVFHNYGVETYDTGIISVTGNAVKMARNVVIEKNEFLIDDASTVNSDILGQNILQIGCLDDIRIRDNFMKNCRSFIYIPTESDVNYLEVTGNTSLNNRNHFIVGVLSKGLHKIDNNKVTNLKRRFLSIFPENSPSTTSSSHCIFQINSNLIHVSSDYLFTDRMLAIISNNTSNYHISINNNIIDNTLFDDVTLFRDYNIKHRFLTASGNDFIGTKHPIHQVSENNKKGGSFVNSQNGILYNSSDNLLTGTVNLKQDINEFSKLYFQFGYIGDLSYETYIFIPFLLFNNSGRYETGKTYKLGELGNFTLNTNTEISFTFTKPLRNIYGEF